MTPTSQPAPAAPPKPILLAVDDNPDVRGAVVADLQASYGIEYRVVSAASGAAALETLDRLKTRGDPVALVLADQRMPRMAGVELLGRTREIYPEARRILLTLLEDTTDALQAINAKQIDYYLTKPWEQPRERIYPVLDDALADWRGVTRLSAAGGIRLVGTRWSPRAHNIREFLGRLQVPYRWLEVETDEDARRLTARAGSGAAGLPLVVFPDGTSLVEPTPATLAEKLGLQTHPGQPFYDLLVVGGGPAGLAAAVYGASEGLRTALVERRAPGGQAGTSPRIENYLGFPAGLSGGDLARRAVAQARRFGAEILAPQEVTGVRIKDRYRIVTLADGGEISCHALLVAAGVSYRTLDVSGADRFTGAGVYYGSAMTEAFACRNQDVYIVGGANSAGQAAVYLSGHARTVTTLVRGPSLSATMSRYLIDQIAETPQVHVRVRSEVVEVHGALGPEAITIRDAGTGVTETVPAAALFVFIGAQPRTDWLAGAVQRDGKGFILTGPDLSRDGRRPNGWAEDRDPYLLETSVPGIFAAGDVRHGSIKRVASGVGEGAMAVSFIHQYLSKG